MNRFYGQIGFRTTVKTAPGVYSEKIVERDYFGDVLRDRNKIGSSDKMNSDISVMSSISIVADPFAYENFTSMRYITMLGMKWTVTNIEIQYPRLIIEIGEKYNE